MCKNSIFILFFLFLFSCSNPTKKGSYEFYKATCDQFPVLMPLGLSDFGAELKGFSEKESSVSSKRKSYIYLLSHDKKCQLTYSFSVYSDNSSKDKNLSCFNSCEIDSVFILQNFFLAEYCAGQTKCPVKLSCKLKDAMQVHSIDYSDPDQPSVKLLIDVNYGTEYSSYYSTCHVYFKKRKN